MVAAWTGAMRGRVTNSSAELLNLALGGGSSENRKCNTKKGN